MRLINNKPSFSLPFEEVRGIVESEHVVIILNVILVQQRVQLLQLQQKEEETANW